jgi:hypothetical protein
MASPSAPIMVGGAKLQDSVLEWSKKSLNLYSTVLMVVIIIAALFADKLPMMARWQLSTTPGRLLLILLLYIIHMTCGWPMALLFTIAIALVWAARPVFKPTGTEGVGGSVGGSVGGGVEGFNDMKNTKATKHKWFIEKTLHENPKAIVEDRINTSAVEGESFVASQRTSK